MNHTTAHGTPAPDAIQGNDPAVRPTLDRMKSRAMIAGAVGLILCVVGLLVDTEQFFRSYLLGYLYWLMIPLGAFALKMLHNLVSGAWGFVIRRFVEAAMKTLPLMALLFVPVILGMHHIYEWTHEDVVAADEVLRHKAAYLNTSFFIIRAVIYFALWIGLGYIVNRMNARQEKSSDPVLTRKIQGVSAAALITLILTTTLASVDWMMSLEPHWFSTIYGVLFIVGAALGALALMNVMVTRFASYQPLAGILRPRMFHDLGNLQFAITMLWAYISLSQFLIIWSGNVAEETPWYAIRMHGGWGVVGWVLVILHFTVPFLILLSRKNKRNAQILGGVALFMLVMRLIDLFWLIVPAFHQGHGGGVEHALFGFHWLDLAAPLGIGGIWLAFYFWNLRDVTLAPLGDPRLQDALERIAHGDEHEEESVTGHLHAGYDHMMQEQKHG